MKKEGVGCCINEASTRLACIEVWMIVFSELKRGRRVCERLYDDDRPLQACAEAG